MIIQKINIRNFYGTGTPEEPARRRTVRVDLSAQDIRDIANALRWRADRIEREEKSLTSERSKEIARNRKLAAWIAEMGVRG